MPKKTREMLDNYLIILDEKQHFSTIQCLPDAGLVDQYLLLIQTLCTIHTIQDPMNVPEDIAIFCTDDSEYPWVVWGQENLSNFRYLVDHMDAIAREHALRNKGGKSIMEGYAMPLVKLRQPPLNVPAGMLTELPMHVPEHYQSLTGKPADVYKMMLLEYVQEGDTWSFTPPPLWFNHAIAYKGKVVSEAKPKADDILDKMCLI